MKSNIARLSSNGFPTSAKPRYGLTCTNVKKRLSRVLTVSLSLSLCRLVSLLCLMMFGPVVKYLEETLPLHQAISEGNVAAAKDIVDQAIIDVNNKDSHGYTALHLAASLKSNKEADLRIAVRHGSHTHRAISLFLSFFLSHTNRSLSLSLCVQFCNILLCAIGVDLLARDDSQNTPLHYLVRAPQEMEERGEYFDVLQKMVTPQTATARNRHGETPLHIAAMYGNTSVVFLLIRNGASTGAKTWCVFSLTFSLSLSHSRELSVLTLVWVWDV